MTPGSVVAVAVVVLAMTFNFAIHKIEEGHVGVYFRGGALLSAITFPGTVKGGKRWRQFRIVGWFSNFLTPSHDDL